MNNKIKKIQKLKIILQKYINKSKTCFQASESLENLKYYKAFPDTKIKSDLKNKIPPYLQNLKDNGEDFGKLFDSPMNNKKMNSISYIRKYKIKFHKNKQLSNENYLESIQKKIAMNKSQSSISRIMKKSNSISDFSNFYENNLIIENIEDNNDLRNCLSCCCKV